MIWILIWVYVSSGSGAPNSTGSQEFSSIEACEKAGVALPKSDSWLRVGWSCVKK